MPRDAPGMPRAVLIALLRVVQLLGECYPSRCMTSSGMLPVRAVEWRVARNYKGKPKWLGAEPIDHSVEPVRRGIGDQVARDLVVAVLARPTHLSVEPIQPKRACFGMPKGGKTWTGMESSICS